MGGGWRSYSHGGGKSKWHLVMDSPLTRGLGKIGISPDHGGGTHGYDPPCPHDVDDDDEGT